VGLETRARYLISVLNHTSMLLAVPSGRPPGQIGRIVDRIRRFVAITLAAALTTASGAKAGAQFGIENGIRVAYSQVEVAQGLSASQAVVYTHADGYLQGLESANTADTGPAFAGGFAWGALLGLVGTGIGYATTGPSSPPQRLTTIIEDRGSDYLLGFHEGFRERSKEKKRSANLTGGLLGAVASAAIILNAM
jgi:hypothetical protein